MLQVLRAHSSESESFFVRPPLRHTSLFKDSYLLLVLAPGGVQRLDECGGVADEHGVAGGSYDHTEHGQPDV